MTTKKKKKKEKGDGREATESPRGGDSEEAAADPRVALNRLSIGFSSTLNPSEKGDLVPDSLLWFVQGFSWNGKVGCLVTESGIHESNEELVSSREKDNYEKVTASFWVQPVSWCQFQRRWRQELCCHFKIPSLLDLPCSRTTNKLVQANDKRFAASQISLKSKRSHIYFFSSWFRADLTWSWGWCQHINLLVAPKGTVEYKMAWSLNQPGLQSDLLAPPN